MDIRVYDARKVTAEASSNGSSNWIDLKITEVVRGRVTKSEVTIFFTGPNAKATVDRLAAAINSASAHEPTETEAA